MRIAFVGTGDTDLDRYPPGGGIEHQVWLLGRELARREHDVTIFTRDRSATLARGLRLVQVPARGRGQVLAKIPMSHRVSKAIQALDPDIVYLSEKWVSYFPSRLDLPLLYATHNKDAFTTYRRQSYRDHPVNLLFFDVKRAIEEAEMRRSHVVGANSQGVLDHVRARGISHAELLPMAVDPDAFRAGDEADPPFLFASGQLLPMKGTRVLLEAFATLPASDWELHIGGRGPERVGLEARARQLGVADRVRFLGWQERAAYVETMSRCAVFVLPSFAETFGTVVLEAMASAKPVVATSITGPVDAVVEGETGALVPPGDAQALARALARLMADASLRARLGAAGQTRVRALFSPSAAADAFERLARKAIARHREAPRA